MAVYKFSTMKQLKQGMDRYLKKILEEIGHDIFLELRQNIKHNIYGWEPSMYDRTRHFYDALKSTPLMREGNGYKVYVYFDANEIEPIMRMPNSWNAHASFVSGEAIEGNILIGWLEYGTDNRYYSHPEYRFYRDTLDWLYEELGRMVEKKLKKYGLKV